MPFALAIVCVLVGVVFVTAVSWPASRRSRERAARRREAFVAAHPHHAKTSDLAPALRREGLDEAAIEAILARAQRDGVPATAMWVWLENLTSDVTASHLRGVATPEASTETPTPAPAAPPTDEPRRNDGLPQVFEPGHLPGLDVPLRRRVSLRENVGAESRGSAA